MPRKNNNAGQPNRQAQAARRTERVHTNKKHHRYEGTKNKMVLGPLSEHLINTGKPEGELVESVQFRVTTKEMVAA